MSRILVVAVGVPGFVAARRHAGPGLRAAHLATAIAAGGHDVLVVAVLGDGETEPACDAGLASVRVLWTTERSLLTGAKREEIAAFAPDAVVGVTAYAAALASRLRLGVPLWADVFGDLMAEAQAKAARSGSDWSIVHFWTLMRAVLERADRFSAVSVAQSHALLGQLGMAGRLSSRTVADELVHVVPCATEPRPGGDGAALRDELGIAGSDFVALVSGSTNTWCDVETLGRGLVLAAREEPRLHVVVTGGAIPGHDEASHTALIKALAPIDGPRVHVLGWVDSTRLASVYAASDVALHIERALVERTLGAENRVVEWLAHSLACETTARSETGAMLVAEGMAIGTAGADEYALARTLVDSLRAPDRLESIAARGRAWVLAERGYEATAAPLVEWCRDPRVASDHGARLLDIGLVSHPETSAEMLEAYVAALPAPELARRGLRWIWRLGWRASSRAFGSLSSRVVAATHRAVGASQRVAGASRRASRALARVLRSASPLVVLACALVGAGCERENAVRPVGRPNVLLISIDTLRADHVGTYGYAVAPSPTPWIDRLAASGVVFEQAVTSAPETAPALASLVTGVYQDRHSVVYNRLGLVDARTTIGERLREAGYATGAIVGNWLVDSQHGFAQGFDVAESVPNLAPVSTTTDDRVVWRAGEFLRKAPEGKPWMLWVHLMDPHGPYNSAPPWWSHDLDYSRAPLVRDGEFPMSDSNFGLGVIPFYQKLKNTKQLSAFVRRYDGDVRFTDAQIGALLGMVAATSDAANTLVVLTADHGESLVEHDELLQHGWFVYDTTVRVPLVVSWPAGLGTDARRMKEQACMVDVLPTILDLVGVAAGGDEFDGRSFAKGFGRSSGSVTEATADARALRAAGCFSIGPRENHPFSLRRAEQKIIVTPAGRPRDPRAEEGSTSSEPERVELYGLVRDPGELHDLSEDRPDLVDEMQQHVARMRARFRAAGHRW